MKNFFSCAVCALGLAACGGNATTEKDPNILMSTDFEGIDGWLPASEGSTLTREQAHSGQTALKVDAAHEFSLTYSKALGQLHDSRPKKLTISTWALVPDAQSAASLVCSVSDPSTTNAKPLLWEAIDLGKESQPYGQWKEVSKVITLPAAASPTSRLSIYLWRTGGVKPVYVDDIKVALAE